MDLVRTQIQITEEQYRKLKLLAVERNLSMSQLIRQGVDRILDQWEAHERWNRLWEVCGSAVDPSGAVDVAENHDRYLSEALDRELGLP